MTLRFGGALNLNVHLPMLCVEGVHVEHDVSPPRKPRLHRTLATTTAQLRHLAETIAHRMYRHLTRKGWLEGEE
ncbi:MAG: transposase [Silanimonas sp.]|nr:transposase [Silanimonas sp.]MCZ8064336.1 transposase [Silanimonas sp.]